MQPYNYTIDLPKPPADNFLQNIMGIAQLQQMSEQQKIAAQQAAFQKEMQPLEMNKVREQIKAAQASAAQSTASTRGLNLSADEVKRQQDYIKEVDTFTSKPVSEWAKEDVERLARLSLTKDAKIGKGIQDFYASQKEPELKLIDNYAMKAGIAISQGRKDVADKITKEGIAEAEKLGFKTASAFFKFGDSQIAEDPAEAYATIVGHLARDKNKLDQFISASELKGKLAETEAKAKKEDALTKKALGESVAAGVEIKDVFTKDLIAKSTEKSTQYTQKSDLAYGILEKINTGEIELPKSFIGRWIQKEIKDAYPLFSNEITALKKDFIKIKNSEAAKNLPPGSASNQDVQFAKEGLTSENASPEQFKKAVESMARLYQLDAKYEEAKAAWLSTNGNLGNSKRDISVLGTDVAKGTGFNQWWKKSASSLIPEQTAPTGPTQPSTAQPEPPPRRRGASQPVTNKPRLISIE
jgi:hypothetical protein